MHISTGAAALSYALLVGKRQDTSEKPPHNMAHVILGTSFIWFGWYVISRKAQIERLLFLILSRLIANAGSGLAPSLRAVTVILKLLH